MKLIFTLTFIVSAHTTAFLQNGIFWSDPIPVAEATFGNSSPRISLLQDGSPAIVWGKSGKIYFSKMVNNEFTDPIQLNTNGVSPGIYNFGGIGMATFDNKIYIVFEKFTSGIYVIRSEDGGETFELPVHAFAVPSGEGTTLPSITVDEEGNPIASVIRSLNNETNARYITVRSNDGGLTFEPPVIASEPADGDFVCECCPADLYTKGENVWLAFRNNNNNKRDMWVSKSEDNATTFTSAIDVDDTDWQVNFCPASAPQISTLTGDSLITVWMSGASGTDRVYFSTLDGNTMQNGWESILPLTNDGDQRRPDIAGQNDTLGMVWEETGFGTNGTDLMFAFSKNGTTGLTSNFTNITDAAGNQRFPSVIYDNGGFHLIYVDGSGPVVYRRGIISEVDGVHIIEKENDFLQLVSQPARNEKIHLRLTKELHHPLSIVLTNIEGKYIDKFELGMPASNEHLFLNTGNTPSGVYFLHAQSGKLNWSSKVILSK